MGRSRDRNRGEVAAAEIGAEIGAEGKWQQQI